MLRWALLFLMVAIVAALLGATGAAYIAAEIAWTIFVVSLILFLASMIIGGIRTGSP